VTVLELLDNILLRVYFASGRDFLDETRSMCSMRSKTVNMVDGCCSSQTIADLFADNLKNYIIVFRVVNLRSATLLLRSI